MGETIWPGEYRRKVTRCKAMRVTTENHVSYTNLTIQTTPTVTIKAAPDPYTQKTKNRDS